MKTYAWKGLLVFALMLHSCVSSNAPTAPRGSFLDKTTYLALNFTQDSLLPDIKKNTEDLSFDTYGIYNITVFFEAQFETIGRKPVFTTISHSFRTKGNSLVQEARELSRNDIPSNLHYNISYLGLLPLKWQNINLQQNKKDTVFEIKKLYRLNRDSKTNEFTFDYAYGSHGIDNQLGKTRITFKAVDVFDAKVIHPKFSGKAVYLKGKQYSNGILRHTKKAVFLQEYGIALDFEIKGSKDTFTYKVVDVQIH